MQIINKIIRKILKRHANNFYSKPRFYKIPFGYLKGLYLLSAPRYGLGKIIGLYEPKVSRVLEEQLTGGDVCIDIGCQIGYTALVMRKLCKEKGYVLAIDPVGSNCKMVKKSFKKNNFENLLCLDIGVGDKEIDLEAYVIEDSGMANFNHSELIKDRNYSKFTIKKLDTVIEEHDFSKVDFIKIDVEGYEDKVLEGAIKTIEKYHPKILVEVHGVDKYNFTSKFLAALGYKIENIEKVSNSPFHVFCSYEKE